MCVNRRWSGAEKIRGGGKKETLAVFEGGWRTASALAVRALIGRNPFIIH